MTSAPITIRMVADGPGQARIVAADGKGMARRAGTAKAISAGFWEATLEVAGMADCPRGPEEGRGPMEPGREALRLMLERWANENGPWWPQEATR